MFHELPWEEILLEKLLEDKMPPLKYPANCNELNYGYSEIACVELEYSEKACFEVAYSEIACVENRLF